MKHGITSKFPLFTLTGCLLASPLLLAQPTPYPVTERAIPWQSAWQLTADQEGQWVMAWHGQRPELVLRTEGEAPITLISRDDMEQAPSGLGLVTTPEGAWVAYRNKQPERGVYLERHGPGGQLGPINLSEDALPLARLRLHAHGDEVRSIWYGERPSEQGGMEYHIHYRDILDDGTLREQQFNLLSGIYPVWLNDAQGNVAVFSWVVDDEQSTIQVRVRQEDGNFAPPVVIQDVTPQITIPFDAFVSGDRWFVYWIAQYGDGNEYLVEGAYSDDQGKTWDAFALESTRGLGVESLSVVGNGEQVTMALAVVDRHHPRRDFMTVKLVQSADNGKTWGELMPVRDEDQVGYARARAPKLALLPDDHVLLMWEDWREIRSRVRYSLSSDGGKHWDIVQDGRLPVGREHNVMVNLFANDIVVTDDRVILGLEFFDDAFSTKQLKVMTLTLEDLKTPDEDVKVSKDGLQERLDAYWKAMIEEDFRGAYNLFDPFYRARVPFSEHLKAMGRIQYETAETEAIESLGHVALSASTVTVSIPTFTSPAGATIESPTQTRTLTLRWVHVDGEWYVDYASEARGGVRFTRH
ncbi:hypothetical protein SAMN05421693_10948 [Ectothiorhodospira magna]|uniref:BNR repeat-like domain-containing protein n=1 Tax=Ectothiorhodospira magna TaxID=867345 RepID=A0A1H9BJH3_9GAMM|nr:sialidase family protein [Ectothiorhodospira magna]SEP89019.1 hypothetical protein SAMN05421693_10948 [Ectothiorhodospira magna]